LIVTKPQLGYRLEAHRVDKNIRLPDERAQCSGALIRTQIEHHAALAAIHIDEHAAHTRRWPNRNIARVVAFRRFDLDDVCTHVGHDLGAIGPHDHGSEVNHTHTDQRALAPRAASHDVPAPAFGYYLNSVWLIG
jgi:hypothetical protein